MTNYIHKLNNNNKSTMRSTAAEAVNAFTQPIMPVRATATTPITAPCRSLSNYSMEGALPAYALRSRSLCTKRSFSLNHRNTKHGSPETSKHGFYNTQHRLPTHRRGQVGGFTLSPKQLATS